MNDITGGCKCHNFLTSRGLKYKLHNRNPDARAMNWYINESILRGSKGGVGPGGVGDFWRGSPEFYWATFTK